MGLADLPKADGPLMSADLFEKWKMLFSLRDTVLLAIEKARAAGEVKAARETKAIVRVQKLEFADLFKRHGLGIADRARRQSGRMEAVMRL